MGLVWTPDTERSANGDRRINRKLPRPDTALHAASTQRATYFDLATREWRDFTTVGFVPIQGLNGPALDMTATATAVTRTRGTIDLDTTEVVGTVAMWIPRPGTGTTTYTFRSYDGSTGNRVGFIINAQSRDIEANFGSQTLVYAADFAEGLNVFAVATSKTAYALWLNGQRILSLTGSQGWQTSPSNLYFACIFGSGAEIQPQILQAAHWAGKGTDFAEYLSQSPDNLWEPRQIWVPASASGGTTYTQTTSLSAAVQAARNASASTQAAVQAARSASAQASAAVQAAGQASASLVLAVQQARTAATAIQAAAQAARSTSTSADAAVRLARAASASLELAVQAALSQTASLSAQVQSSTSLSASLSAQVQAASSASVAASAAVLDRVIKMLGFNVAVFTAPTATAGLSAALARTLTAATALQAAVQMLRTAGPVADVAVMENRDATSAIDAAVRATAAAVTALQAAVAENRVATTLLQAAVAAGTSLSALASAGVSATRTLGAAIGAYISGGTGGGADPAAVWAYVMPDGRTAEAVLMENNLLLRELHRIHGLQASAPLVVTPTSRVAGDITQSIGEAGGDVTVTRLP